MQRKSFLRLKAQRAGETLYTVPGKGRLCGFLLKESPHAFKIGSPKRRWFALEGHDIIYYVDPGDTKSLGCINLLQVSAVTPKDTKVFILSTPKREWVLHAKSNHQRDYWVNGISVILAEIRTRKQKRSANPPSPSAPGVPRLASPFAHSEPQNIDTPRFSQPRTSVEEPSRLRIGSPRSTSPSKEVLHHRKLRQLRKNESEAKQLADELRRVENEEMKLLLGALSANTRPLPPDVVTQQLQLENRVTELFNLLVEKQAATSVLNTELQFGSASPDWQSRRQQRYALPPPRFGASPITHSFHIY